MPPKEPPAETADAADLSVATEAIAQAREASYQEGYADGHKLGYQAGLIDGKPKLGIFESARRDAVLLPPHLADNDALRAIEGIMERKTAEYGEKLPFSDRDLLFAAWARSTKNREKAMAFPPGQRVSKEPPSGPPNVEYELVT